MSISAVNKEKFKMCKFAILAIMCCFITLTCTAQSINFQLPVRQDEYLTFDKPDDNHSEKDRLHSAMQDPFPTGSSNGNGLQAGKTKGFDWKRAAKQSLFLLAIMHSYNFASGDGAREELRGPFFKDYFQSVKNLRGWDDGDPFIADYVAHPMQGAVAGFIQIQNDPKGIGQEFAMSKAYWNSRLKAAGFALLFSTQWEIGPLSEASLGNIGLKPYEGSPHPMAWVDMVITPSVGTAWLVGEDMLDRFVICKLENKFSNRVLRVLIRSFLNPSRSMANILRFEHPWYRDRRAL
jgi:hypothetical protein